MKANKLMISTLLVSLAFTTGTTGTNPNSQKPAKQTAAATAPSHVKLEALPLDDIKRFTAAFAEIKNYYVDSVPSQKLFDDAIRGMVSGLDPHSAYLDQDEYQDLKLDTSGKFSGLGMEVTSEDGVVKVVTPMDGSPAAKAGIKSKDLIVRINDAPVRGMKLEDAIKAMRGPDGTTVRLTVIREGVKNPIELTLRRASITVESVKSKMLEPGYGYIRISEFQEPTAAEFDKAVIALNKQAGGQLKGLVVDLRNNPGGLLDSAVDVADEMLDKKFVNRYNHQIVFTKGRLPGSELSIQAKPGDLTKGAPIVLLINSGSASGAEIVAGALQDYHRAILVGTRSFGKGSVQTVLPLDDKTGVKLTTALYYTPSGRSIQDVGIKPDVTVDNLKVEKNADHTAELLDSYKEADLSGNLANPQNKKLTTEQLKNLAALKDQTAGQDDLATSDYQLYEAMHLLKAMVVLE